MLTVTYQIFEVFQFAKQIPENQFLQNNLPVTIILQETSFNYHAFSIFTTALLKTIFN